MAQGNDSVPQTTLSELIPIGDISMDQRAVIRKQVDDALVKVALSKAISNTPAGLVVRDTLPFTDLALTGSTSAEDWLITSVSVAGTFLAFVNARQLSTTQCLAFWGVSEYTNPSNISALKFTFGPGAGSQVKLVVQLQQLIARLEAQGFFSTPLVYVAQDTFSVFVMPLIAWAASTERLVLLSRIVDQFGNIISAHNYA